MTLEQFHAHVERVMFGVDELYYSHLRNFASTPAEYKKSRMFRTPQTKPMKEGVEFHCACLENEKFKETYDFFDDTEIVEKLKQEGAKSPRSKKEYQAWKAEEIIKHEGKILLDREWHETLLSMEDALMTNPITGPIMRGLFSREEKHGTSIDDFLIGAKIDGVGEIIGSEFIEDGPLTIDLKKVENASWKKVKWKIEDEFYDVQGAINSYCTGINRHVIIFIDKQCRITPVLISRDKMEDAKNKLLMILDRYRDCAEENRWDASFEFWYGGVCVW